jgi:hypothetical protein
MTAATKALLDTLIKDSAECAQELTSTADS